MDHKIDSPYSWLEQEPSYHGTMTQSKAESELAQNMKDSNCYLTRYSKTNDLYRLSVVGKKKNGKLIFKHFKICKGNDSSNQKVFYRIENSREKFSELKALLRHYETQSISKFGQKIGKAVVYQSSSSETVAFDSMSGTTALNFSSKTSTSVPKAPVNETILPKANGSVSVTSFDSADKSPEMTALNFSARTLTPVPKAPADKIDTNASATSALSDSADKSSERSAINFSARTSTPLPIAPDDKTETTSATCASSDSTDKSPALNFAARTSTPVPKAPVSKIFPTAMHEETNASAISASFVYADSADKSSKTTPTKTSASVPKPPAEKTFLPAMCEETNASDKSALVYEQKSSTSTPSVHAETNHSTTSSCVYTEPKKSTTSFNDFTTSSSVTAGKPPSNACHNELTMPSPITKSSTKFFFAKLVNVDTLFPALEETDNFTTASSAPTIASNMTSFSASKNSVNISKASDNTISFSSSEDTNHTSHVRDLQGPTPHQASNDITSSSMREETKNHSNLFNSPIKVSNSNGPSSELKVTKGPINTEPGNDAAIIFTTGKTEDHTHSSRNTTPLTVFDPIPVQTNITGTAATPSVPEDTNTPVKLPDSSATTSNTTTTAPNAEETKDHTNSTIHSPQTSMSTKPFSVNKKTEDFTNHPPKTNSSTEPFSMTEETEEFTAHQPKTNNRTEPFSMAEKTTEDAIESPTPLVYSQAYTSSSLKRTEQQLIRQIREHPSYHGVLTLEEAVMQLRKSTLQRCYITSYNQDSKMHKVSVQNKEGSKSQIKHLNLIVESSDSSSTCRIEGSQTPFKDIPLLLFYHEIHPVGKVLENIGMCFRLLERTASHPSGIVSNHIFERNQWRSRSASENDVTTFNKLSLKAVFNLLYDIRLKWYDLGIELEIPTDILDEIREKCSNKPGDCLNRMIQWWLKSDHPRSWRTLSEALAGKVLNEKRLSQEVSIRSLTKKKSSAPDIQIPNWLTETQNMSNFQPHENDTELTPKPPTSTENSNHDETPPLSKDDLKFVRSFLHKVRGKWYDIGVELEISDVKLEEIKREYNNDAGHCLREMIREFLQDIDNPPTLIRLQEALKAPPVDEKDLSKKVLNVLNIKTSAKYKKKKSTTVKIEAVEEQISKTPAIAPLVSDTTSLSTTDPNTAPVSTTKVTFLAEDTPQVNTTVCNRCFKNSNKKVRKEAEVKSQQTTTQSEQRPKVNFITQKSFSGDKVEADIDPLKPKEIFSHPSYHGSITVQEATNLLKEQSPGSNCYLTRYCMWKKLYIISVFSVRKCHELELKLCTADSGVSYKIDTDMTEEPFDDIDDLLKFYRENSFVYNRVKFDNLGKEISRNAQFKTYSRQDRRPRINKDAEKSKNCTCSSKAKNIKFRTWEFD